MVYILPDEKDSETNEDQPKEPETTVEEVDQDTTEEDNKEKDPDEEKHPKAAGSGTCYVYIYAKNGYTKKVKVTVK